jgi:hypothetical protein
LVSLLVVRVEVKQPAKIQIVRFLIGGSRFRDPPLLGSLQSDLQGRGDAFGNGALDGEHVARRAVVRPPVPAP